jgi:signal transduction histidine kinase
MSATPDLPGPSALPSASPSAGLEWGSAAPNQPLLWIGWRRRLLVLAALLGCLGLFAWTQWLSQAPYIDAQWGASADGRLVLQSSSDPALKGLEGKAMQALGPTGQALAPTGALLLHRSPRWQVDDSAREQQNAQQEQLAAALATGAVDLLFDSGSRVTVRPQPRGLAGLGLLLWPLAGLSLLLYLFAVVVVLARPGARNLLFAVMALCQAGNLLFIGMESARGLGLPPGSSAADLGMRLALDAFTGAAMVHVFLLHPIRQRRAQALAWSTWLAASVALILIHWGELPYAWWWGQGLCLGLGLLGVWVVRRSLQIEPNPYAKVMMRLGLVTLATLVLVTAAVAAGSRLPLVAHGVAVGASVAWYLFLTSLLLLAPFLNRSRQVLREFALLAGVSTVAASVDLLFVAVFSLGAFTSLAVAVFVALALYTGARQYVLQHLLGRNLLTTERTFDLLYRAARNVRARPNQYQQELTSVLRALFEPLEVVQADRVPSRARVSGGGASMVVPLRLSSQQQPLESALLLRFAQGGQRLFGHDDARLADRVVDQLRRAMAYDQAVERGRHEERQRLAQDLHDDIGARLLTLMYQAQSTEMEDYIRHTLQDLKTLTRGLAATEHHLSHAAAEWKADLTQRLNAAQAVLGWEFEYEQDMPLTVVQWSALTRILRELVSNSLYHGHATRIDVSIHLRGRRLALKVSDDGQGCDPQLWAHGLGLGGVRKRVKSLGGTVRWSGHQPRGIACEVLVDTFGPDA